MRIAWNKFHHYKMDDVEVGHIIDRCGEVYYVAYSALRGGKLFVNLQDGKAYTVADWVEEGGGLADWVTVYPDSELRLGQKKTD